jgi:hypothetical protein
VGRERFACGIGVPWVVDRREISEEESVLCYGQESPRMYSRRGGLLNIPQGTMATRFRVVSLLEGMGETLATSSRVTRFCFVSLGN